MFKQYQVVLKNWSDSQLKTGQDWFESVQGADKFQPEFVWAKTLDAYQASVQESLKAEKAGAKILFEEVAALKGMPKEATEWVKLWQGVNEQIIGMQEEYVDTWFKILRQFNFTGFSKGQPVTKA
jgi:hypothetical protein